MATDDAVYLIVLTLSISFGCIFVKIENEKRKKWMSTCLGLLICIAVSGYHISHPVITTFVVGIFINYTSKRYCHILTFIFSFAYLLFFKLVTYFDIPHPPAHTNLIQMMLTLKLIGLSFEVHDSSEIMKLKKNGEEIEDKLKFKFIETPSILDVFHYAFSYIGVLTGPYYKYRTFLDMIESRYTDRKICIDETVEKIKVIPVLLVLYVVTSWIFPLDYLIDEKFYEERSFLFRLWYLYPSFFIFRLRMYAGCILSECVCTMAGLGLYPCITEPRPGMGPSYDFGSLFIPKEEIPEHPLNGKFNFKCIQNVDLGNAEFKPTVRFAMRYWNMTVQYWLADYVYSRFPSKTFRTAAVFLTSAVWHGVHPGYYLSLLSVPLYLHVEDLYEKKLRFESGTVSSQIVWTAFLYTVKMLQFSYWGVAFQLLYIDRILRYWSSIYYFPYLVVIAMYLYVQLLSFTKAKIRKN